MSIIERPRPPEPWAEGDNIPWNDPAFSERMLREHLNQDHDLASRRIEKIDRHVQWIHDVVLEGRPTKILDLACGPGLYTNRLAARGHACVGVDFSPAAIAHAAEIAERKGLSATYIEADVRSVDPGSGFGLVMMLWGQFNVFRRAEAATLLSRAHRLLNPGGQFLLEPQTHTHVERAAQAGPSWRTVTAGLFSERPHLLLEESFWDEAGQTSTTRFHVIDAQTGDVTRHALSSVAYPEAELMALLSGAGLDNARAMPSLDGAVPKADPATVVMLAQA